MTAISLPFLVAVAILESALALNCTEPYQCTSVDECFKAHGGAPPEKAVLFRCSPGGRLETRVCCPDPTVKSVPFAVKADIPTMSLTTKQPEKLQPVGRISSGSKKLLPGRKECGLVQKRDIDEKEFVKNSDRNSTIYTGRPVDEGAYPWLVLLFSTSETGKDFPFCGGSLISRRYVLTSAHCTVENNRIKFVRLGELNYSKKECKNCPQDVNVEKIIIHELFNMRTGRNDIALLRLERDVLPNSNPNIAPICLPVDTIYNATRKAGFRIAGWGKNSRNHFTTEGSSDLREVVLRATGECSSNCPEGSAICPISKTLQICIETARGMNPCQVDTGGPLMLKLHRNAMAQIGIASLIPRICGRRGIPVIYTRVDGYLQWIHDQIKP